MTTKPEGMTSNRPYLLRALYQWITDNELTPHILVDAEVEGVVVPEHTIQKGESIWILALRKYNVPIWLFRQYNPEVDMHKVRPGTKVQIPLLTDVERG